MCSLPWPSWRSRKTVLGDVLTQLASREKLPAILFRTIMASLKRFPPVRVTVLKVLRKIVLEVIMRPRRGRTAVVTCGTAAFRQRSPTGHSCRGSDLRACADTHSPCIMASVAQREIWTASEQLFKGFIFVVKTLGREEACMALFLQLPKEAVVKATTSYDDDGALRKAAIRYLSPNKPDRWTSVSDDILAHLKLQRPAPPAAQE